MISPAVVTTRAERRNPAFAAIGMRMERNADRQQDEREADDGQGGDEGTAG